jgi:hypothetical protein
MRRIRIGPESSISHVQLAPQRVALLLDGRHQRKVFMLAQRIDDQKLLGARKGLEAFEQHRALVARTEMGRC